MRLSSILLIVLFAINFYDIHAASGNVIKKCRDVMGAGYCGIPGMCGVYKGACAKTCGGCGGRKRIVGENEEGDMNDQNYNMLNYWRRRDLLRQKDFLQQLRENDEKTLYKM
ncbi:uncharacterized protein [Clytia hemisphaerica]